MALSTAAPEVICLKGLSGDVCLVTGDKVFLKGDDHTALQMAQEARLNKASKQIIIDFDFICEKLEHEDKCLQYVQSEENLAHTVSKRSGGRAKIIWRN